VSDNVVLGIALAMMLVALPLISIGTENEVAALWWAGVVLIGLAALAGPLTRYALDGDGDGDDDDEEDGG
jgi:hypothetical protein